MLPAGVQAVLFDLDDTLIPEEPGIRSAGRAACEPVQERYGLECDRLFKAVREQARSVWRSLPSHASFQALGISSWEGLRTSWEESHPSLRSLGRDLPEYRRKAWRNGLQACGIDDPALAEALAERLPVQRQPVLEPFPETREILEACRRSFRLGLVTNGPSDIQRDKIRRSAIPPVFEAMSISAEVGWGKPDPRIFAHALERLGVSADLAVMVGDNLDRDVAGARQAGIRALWLNREGLASPRGFPDSEAIRSLGDLPERLLAGSPIPR